MGATQNLGGVFSAPSIVSEHLGPAVPAGNPAAADCALDARAPLVRRATMGDLDTLVNFSLALCGESDGRLLDPDVVRAGVRTMLDGPDWLILVAVNDAGCVVGEIMVGGREWYDWANGEFWWITSVYVHPDWRRRGVGRALYAKVREFARLASPKVVGIRGCVRQDNTLAQAALNKLNRRYSGQLVFEERLNESPLR